jgi:glycosyltransferase involved in cell wall biosynthesis
VAAEKNIEAFLATDLPGSKVVVGDGPARPALEQRYPGVHWAGFRFGEDLARHYAAADVFVFPSLTDTFGVVMLEANACGLPVAAFPVPGPLDVVLDGHTGALDEDLGRACRRALELDRQHCRTYALGFSWQRCASLFFDNLAVFSFED